MELSIHRVSAAFVQKMEVVEEQRVAQACFS